MVAICLPRVIRDTTLAEIRALMDQGPFLPGCQTETGTAGLLKYDLELDPTSEAAARAVNVLVAELRASSAFQAATWTEAMSTPSFCRYETGMSYREHTDGPLLGDPPMQLRCDLAVTICLDDGAAYDGGSLVIESSVAPYRWKGEAGDCLIYPAGVQHCVETVNRGARRVAEFWIQSMVRDPTQRRILFDLKEALDELDGMSPAPPHIEALRRSFFNLTRMWA
jgi:PKHD-type hydroxylase